MIAVVLVFLTSSFVVIVSGLVWAKCVVAVVDSKEEKMQNLLLRSKCMHLILMQREQYLVNQTRW